MTGRYAAFALVVAASLAAGADPPAAAVLLLDNQQVLTGQIEKVGDQYRVRRNGGETVVPAGRVAAACADIGAAYQFLRTKVSDNDADGRLRLARWCDSNGLRAEAAAEAKRAAELAPNRAVIRATYEQLQRRADLPAPPQAPAVLPAAILSAPVESVDCGAEVFKKFATKVQPVLMNTCASCHAGEHAGRFRLERVYTDGVAGRTATQKNLAITVALIDRSKPSASPLLQSATTAHGGAALPPLRDRGVPAFRQLDEWVKLVVGEGPAATEQPPQSAVVSTVATTPSTVQNGEFATPPPTKEERPGPKDPFDPTIFNQQHHPDGPKP
jgi:hypothetical protein